MAVLVTAIHVFFSNIAKTWMAGTRPSAGPAMKSAAAADPPRKTSIILQ
jgi:hypothetical protein